MSAQIDIISDDDDDEDDDDDDDDDDDQNAGIFSPKSNDIPFSTVAYYSSPA